MVHIPLVLTYIRVHCQRQEVSVVSNEQGILLFYRKDGFLHNVELLLS